VVGGKLHDLEQEWAAELSVRDADVVLVVLVLRFPFPSLSCSTSMAKITMLGNSVFLVAINTRESSATTGGITEAELYLRLAFWRRACSCFKTICGCSGAVGPDCPRVGQSLI
jgi:hypothetical protein